MMDQEDIQADFDTIKGKNVRVLRPGDRPAEPQTIERGTQCTDLGNAERLVDQHGEVLRHCLAFRKWFIWDGVRFADDRSGTVSELAKQTTRSIYDEAYAHAGTSKYGDLSKHAVKSESKTRIDAMIALAETDPIVTVLPEQLDSDPWLLNCPNGTLDLRTGELREARQSDLITMSTTVPYNPEAECPSWISFLDWAMCEDADMGVFVQRALGYSLTGDVSERVLFICHGEGKNGKSTMLETMRSILGDFSTQTPTDTIVAKRNDDNSSNDVARLRSKRFVVASESDEGQRLAESKIKHMTGNDVISARFLYQEFFDFMPEFKLWIGTNHKPVIKGTDNAIWDRIRLIPFLNRIEEDKRDPDLRKKLLAEAEGILAWAVRGCLEWQRYGLTAPVAVADATDTYRSEMDTYAAFIDECCELDPGFSITTAALYAVYNKWATDSGEKPDSKRKFSTSIEERGFKHFRTKAARGFHGIRTNDI